MRGTSIIVTFYQGVSSLKMCLALLKETLPPEEKIEILIVNDNPSVALTPEVVECDVRIINMENNLGYAAACNRAAKEANYDTLLFMDCDIYPTSNWFEYMKKTFEDIGEAGCVSATILETNTGNLFGYGMAVYNVDVLLFLRHGKPTTFSQIDRDVPIISSGCMMVNRKKYLEIGGQDEMCVNNHCDVDFTFRMLRAGYRNRMCSKAIVYHRGQVSGAIRTVPFRQDVKAYLFKKWGDTLSEFCNVPKWLNQIWSCFDGSRIEGKKVIIVSVSNSLSRHDYIRMLQEKFHLEILQLYDIKNVSGGANIILQEIVPWNVGRLHIPIIYFADDYRVLLQNYYWYQSRACEDDVIFDKNGNAFYTADI